MYGVDIARCNSSFPKDKETFDKICPLLKEVLGYNDHEIQGFNHWLFYPPLAMNLTKEEVRLIIQPFWDNDISGHGREAERNDEFFMGHYEKRRPTEQEILRKLKEIVK